MYFFGIGILYLYFYLYLYLYLYIFVLTYFQMCGITTPLTGKPFLSSFLTAAAARSDPKKNSSYLISSFFYSMYDAFQTAQILRKTFLSSAHIFWRKRNKREKPNKRNQRNSPSSLLLKIFHLIKIEFETMYQCNIHIF